MTRIHDDPAAFAVEALQGLCDVYPQLLRPLPVRGGVLRATETATGKVALVVGGGSGHYPAFAGYVGQGMADAAVCGDVFASPSARHIYETARAAERGGGVILAYGNYAGDVLNFGLAAERLRAAGIDARTLATSDDVASAPADQAATRRGVAGDLPVFKITGAAAEAGLPIDEVDRIGRAANARTRSFGVAFAGCTLPGEGAPLFRVPEGHMALGLGLHGEPGIAERELVTAGELATLLVDKLLEEVPAGAGRRVAAILNGLGSTKYEELFLLWHRVQAGLRDAGLEPVAPEVGEYATSLDMAGCSLTLVWLDEELERYWLAPAAAPGFRRGHCPPAELATALPAAAAEAPTSWPRASDASQADGRRIAALMRGMAEALAQAEDELGRIDAQAGDGDHGHGMARGSAAAAQAAERAAAGGAGARSVLAAAAQAWADRAGGTSGAIWGLLLLQWSQSLSDRERNGRAAIAAGARAGLEGVVRLGGARVGDKTLVDALTPFVHTLETEAADKPLAEAWRVAAEAATRAAEATRELLPRLGRARPLAERSKGHPDAGAISLALCARTAAGFIASTETVHEL